MRIIAPRSRESLLVTVPRSNGVKTGTKHQPYGRPYDTHTHIGTYKPKSYNLLLMSKSVHNGTYYVNVVIPFACGLLGHAALSLDDNLNEGTQARC